MKYFYYLALPFFLTLSLLACKKESILVDGKDFTLDYEFTLDLNNQDFQIHFDELLEDSRCPPFVLCQWEGRAKIRIITISGEEEKEYEFSTFGPTQMDTIFESGNDRYQFEILEINPFPNSFQAPVPEDYSIEFNLTQL